MADAPRAAAAEPRQALLAAAEAFGLEPVGAAAAAADPCADAGQQAAAGAPAQPGRGRRLPRSFQAAEEASQALPELRFASRLVYAATDAECAEACADLLKPGAENGGKEPLALGFDVEWRASFQRGVAQPPAATVQLATREFAVVFHLSRCGGLPEPLAALLGRPDVLKVGVGAEGDAHKLERDYPGRKLAAGGDAVAAAEAPDRFRARGVLDLNDLASRALAGKPGARPKASLAALCEELLRHQLPKPPEIRCGNWEAVPLSEEQLRYAATDAWAGFRCFEELSQRAPEAVAEVAAAVRSDTVPAAASARKRPAPADGREREPIAAAASLADLPPSKRCVYRLFFENGLAADSIAELRGIQTSTVLGYLTDAITAGYAYDLADFELSTADREAIAEALSALPPSESARTSLKAVKEALPERIDYWAIRLVQAHLARTGAAATPSEGAAGSTAAAPVAERGAEGGGDASAPRAD